MNRKNKNILIGGLLAVVFVMAVGYAVFSTTLNINGSATISSEWNVAFDTSVTSGSKTGTATCGTVTYSNNNATATISNTTLVKPTDKCTYTLKVQNLGNLAASVSAASISTCPTGWTKASTTCTSSTGNLKFTVSSSATTLAAKNGSTTASSNVIVTAEFVDKTVTQSSTESGTVAIGFSATQV